MHPFKPEEPQPSPYPQYSQQPVERPAYPHAPTPGHAALSESVAYSDSLLPPPAHVGDEPVERYAKISQVHEDEIPAPQPPPEQPAANTPAAAAEEHQEPPPVPGDSGKPPVGPPKLPPGTGGEEADPPGQPFEVRHTPLQTLLVSTNHPQPALVNVAAEELANGIPHSWHELVIEEGSSATYYCDDPVNPRFFVKSRGDATVQQQILDAARHEDARHPAPPGDLTNVELTDGLVNVDTEMEIAPQVAKVVDSDTMQAAVQAHGFKSVKLVQPLMAATHKSTDEKCTVYPWLKAEAPTGEEQLDTLDDIADQLAGQLYQTGIVPLQLSSDNFKISTDPEGNSHLHIVGISTYKKVSQLRPDVVETFDTIYRASPAETVHSPQPDPYEIRHNGVHTTFVSTHPNQRLVEYTARTLSSGVPIHWYPIPTTGESNYYTDSLAYPSVFVKIQQSNAAAIVPELTLAPAIQQAMRHPDAQAIVQRFGYVHIEAVTPLAAGINGSTGQQWIAYQWVKGYTPGEHLYDTEGMPLRMPETSEIDEIAQLQALGRSLKAHLAACGVNVGELTPQHFRVGTTPYDAPKLYLIRTASFTRRP